ncbi:hypothetical protein [Komagataeibacter xylinus]|uniref:hypothetical protein n=1 Tax=Komagataeibacter xylinus TaxID=28448 RepID=UPI00102F35F5|nr:hypothetical protein [Komagataeibacter xylinus]
MSVFIRKFHLFQIGVERENISQAVIIGKNYFILNINCPINYGAGPGHKEIDSFGGMNIHQEIRFPGCQHSLRCRKPLFLILACIPNFYGAIISCYCETDPDNKTVSA